MRVFFIRHGQSQDNKENRSSGWSQSPLSELGHRQAASVEPVLRGIKFDKVFSSDLLRAIQTAHHALPGYELILDERLREISVGTTSGENRVELAERFGDVFLNAYNGYDYTAFDGENDDMINERMFSFMRYLETIEGCENIAVFGHEGTVHQMMNYVIGCRMDLRCLRMPNCSVSVFAYEKGRWKVEKFSYTANMLPPFLNCN